MADILFLNFNGNTSSIAAAKKAALKRGEKVIVYPNETIKKITSASLDLIFKDITAKKLKITNISLSGHDGGGSFAGKDGDIGKEDVKNALKKYPAIKNSVKSLLLRGCYSATMGQVQSQSMNDWRMIFPKVEFISGYNDPAESSERAESKEFVEDMLNLESEFLQDKSLKDVLSTFKKVGLYNQMDAAVWIRQCNSFGPSTSHDGIYLTSAMTAQNNNPVLISEERKRCEKTRQETEKHMAIYVKYISGNEKGYERPPKEHQGTDLRAAYSYIRQNEHCIPILMPGSETGYNPDRIIRLIYYDYIVSNFQDMYPSAPITKAIEANFKGTELQNLKYPDLTKASRRDIKAYISRLEGAAQNLYSTAKNDKDPKAVAGLKMWKHAQAMNASVGMIMPFHVPFSWVSEPHAQIPLSGLH
jgi:hypothetical protein